ncbi:MAG: insulinase family protein [Candidatus Melainabacteria bacterium]|nr:insulinase family protein [Candidatus Melainabacteria bacterium]
MKSSVKYITERDGIREYFLPNGLKVLLKQNHSIPLISFSIWYKVGSQNETKGIYGLAHFLEHMMFKGTNKYKRGEISAIIQKYGGIFNAFTSCDGTAYYETISPKYLEKVIEIESDRMKGSLLSQDELNLERTVVLSELEGDLNNPVTLLDQTLRFTAYEKGPYKNPTIGYEKDIRSIDSKIMRDFYNRFYNPNNATIVLVGDFNESNATNLIEKHFGSIKNTNSTNDHIIIEKDSPQKEEKRITVKRSGSFKLLEIAYHTTDAKNKDLYPLNVIEEILIKGKKSPLNKVLVEAGLATEVSGGAEINKEPGLFYFLVSLTPKATHKKVETIITNEINKLIKNPPSEEEILAAKNRIKADYLFNLDGTYNQALNIGYFESVNDWKQSTEWLDEISKVTKEEISTALKNYFQKENRTVGYFIPKMQKGTKYENLPINLSRTQHYKNTSLVESTKQSSLSSEFQRLFKYKELNLKDGSELLIYKNIDLPITYLSGIIKGGSSLLPKEDELNCEIIARTLEKGSKHYTKEQIESILDKTGSHIDFGCDEESFKFNVASTNDNLIQTVDLFTDILMNPIFTEKETNKEKDKLIAEIIESKDSTEEIGRRRFNQIIYTKGHPYYSNDFEEDIKIIKNINNKNLFSYHERLIKNNKAIISITSNLKDKDIKSVLDILEKNIFNGTPKTEGKINIPDTLLRDIPKTESINVEDKMQSDVYLGHAGNLRRTDPDFYKLHIANYIFGGSSLASRLSKRIRDDSGLVYRIYSYINASHGKGEFGIYFGANNKNVDKAIELIKEELNKFVTKGITEDELKKAKASLIDSFISRNLSTNRSISSTIAGIEFYDLGNNYINNYPKIIDSLKLDEINTAIKNHIFPDKLNIVIAGEYKNIKK